MPHRPHARVATFALVLAATTLLAVPAALAKRAPKRNFKADAEAILRAGIKSADFETRGLAYQGLGQLKRAKDVPQILKDGEADPQWVVRAGVVAAYIARRDKRYKQVAFDAMRNPMVPPSRVLPALEKLKTRDVAAFLVETVGDPENDRQNAIVDALVASGRGDTGELIATLVNARKCALCKDGGLRAIRQLKVPQHLDHLAVVAKKLSRDDDAIGALLKVAARSRETDPVEYLAKLKTKDDKLARMLVMERARHGDRGVADDVLKLAEAATGDARVKILEAFAPIASKSDAGKLKQLLGKDPGPKLAFIIYETLARLGDRSLAAGAEKLANSTDVKLRPTGVYYLGRVGGAGMLPDMHRYLGDNIPDVRIAAARAIGHYGSPISVDPLQNAIRQERVPQVRVEFLKALTGIKDQKAIAALRFMTREKDEELRQMVVRALADSGDPAARQGLMAGVRDNSAEVRFEAVRGFIISDPAQAVKQWKRALGRLPEGAIVRLTREFKEAMTDYIEIALLGSRRPAVRDEALEALRLLPKAEYALLTKLLATSDDDALKVRLLDRMYRLEGKKVAPQIKAMAVGGSVRVRVHAIRLLGELSRDKEARDYLEKFLDETIEKVRVAAALTYLGG